MWRIHVVEDHPLMRAAIVREISAAADLEPHGETGTAADALTRVVADPPDVLLCDLHLPDRSALWLLSQLATHEQAPPVLLLSADDDLVGVEASIDAGAAGYVHKHADEGELVDCVRRVADGATHVYDRATAARVIDRLRRGADDEALSLTPRERDVLAGAAAGSTNRVIARGLGVSEDTVKDTMARILAKLDVPDRTAAVAIALRRGLLR